MANLSKSKIMTSLQCHKALHFAVHQPGLAQYSSQTQAAFDTGNLVGDIARKLYGGGLLIEYGPDMVKSTLEAMAHGPVKPIYEATLVHEGVLVRLDALLPAGDKWRIVEVKSSTKLKDEHVPDCAVQAWVFRGAGYEYESIALAHIDNTFVYPGKEDYRGLLTEVDLTDQVENLQAEAANWVSEAHAAADGPLPDVPVGGHCSKPYSCAFFDQCWPIDAKYPVHGLKGSKAKLAELVQAGYRDIRDVPAELLTGAAHQRIHGITCAESPELPAGAKAFVDGLAYPRYYLDFETVGPAVPIWPGTRPYETLAVQWSCHIEEAPGEVRHEEFLQVTPEPPMRALAESLIEVLGGSGPVLMYTNYEEGVIKGLAQRYPELAPALGRILGRLEDLHPVAKANYYHPDMLGSWSIKAVMPTIDPAMDYAKLEEIKEGNAASSAYLEAIRPGTDAKRRKDLEEKLLRYCCLDTEVMVRMVQFFETGH